MTHRQITRTLINTTDTLKELAIIYLTILSICALAFMCFEHKALFDSIWWACVTSMTVGYGDIYPVTAGGRIVGMFLMHVVPLALIPIITARITSKLVVDSDAFTHKEQESIKHDLISIKKALNIK